MKGVGSYLSLSRLSSFCLSILPSMSRVLFLDTTSEYCQIFICFFRSYRIYFTSSIALLLFYDIFVICPLERKSHSILRAELPSNSSSEGRSSQTQSPDSSELVSHQMALSEARLEFFLLIYLRALLSSFLNFSHLGPLRRSDRT